MRFNAAESKRRSSRQRFGPLFALLALAAVATGGYFGFWRYHLKRFQAVREGVLYRTGQPTELGLRYLAGDCGVKTVLTLQLFDPQLYRGWIDPGRPSGARESDFVAQTLGVHLVQWPMGRESCWPWMAPWQFEDFFELFDDPANWPVCVHCMGGRHRTGTISALFRLEYDRWPVEQVLAEMYSFKFGEAIPMQEYNLRTYLPRPHPDAAAWRALRAEFAATGVAEPAADYEALVHSLRTTTERAKMRRSVAAYIAAERPFALALALRLIDNLDDALVAPARELASQVLERPQAEVWQWQMAAALVADFGTPSQQARLLDCIEHGSHEATVNPRYAALVAGVSNRYTWNRLPYLRPVLEDERLHIEPGAENCRYCYVALVRIAAITDQRWVIGFPERPHWDTARNKARVWLAAHADEFRPGPLKLPPTNNAVLASEERDDEDLSHMRR